jgi:uncharacterized protein YjbI with pentapeptide repeats
MRVLERGELLAAKSINCSKIRDYCLSDENLGQLRANDSEFSGVDLSRANLNGIRWRNCTLSRVSLDEARASSVVMRLCTFIRVSATETHFESAIIENCKASGCDFRNADFTDASLTDSDFNRSTFEGADLTGTDASYCNLRGVDFRSAVLKNTSFRDADLRGADFSGAVVDNTDFRGADIRGAQFDEPVAVQLGPEPPESPPTAVLVTTVAPLVANLLNRAEKLGVIEESAWQSELEETLLNLGAGPLDMKRTAEWDAQVGDLLQKAGDIGVDRLLDALKSDSEEAPPAVAKMLEGLSRDLGLKPSASSEELLSALLAKLRKT